MVSLAEEVKALIDMGIPPQDALAAVRADRERRGEDSSSSNAHDEEQLPSVPEDSSVTKTYPSKSNNSHSMQGKLPSSRPGLSRPLSYNRPGIITHVNVDDRSDSSGARTDDEDEGIKKLKLWLMTACEFSEAESKKLCTLLQAEGILSKESLTKKLKDDKSFFISGSKVGIRQARRITDQLREEGLVVAPLRSTVSHSGDDGSPSRRKLPPHSPQRSSAPVTPTPMSSVTKLHTRRDSPLGSPKPFGGRNPPDPKFNSSELSSRDRGSRPGSARSGRSSNSSTLKTPTHADSSAKKSKFYNKVESNGVLDEQRALKAEFSTESVFVPACLIPSEGLRRFWRDVYSIKKESVSIDIFVQSVIVHLTEEEDIHKSEAKMCLTSARKVLEKMDINKSNRASLPLLQHFMKPYGVEMRMFDAFMKLRNREDSGMLLVPPLPPRYIALQYEKIDTDIDHALSKPGLVRVVGPPRVGKSMRVLAACHRLPSDYNCIWIDLTSEVNSPSDILSRISSEIGLTGRDTASVLQCFRKFLSMLSSNTVIVFDQADSEKCLRACKQIFSICLEHHVAAVVVSRTTHSCPDGAQIDIEDATEMSLVRIGLLSKEDAARIAEVFTTDTTLLSKCAEYLPGHILALGSLSTSYLKQISRDSDKTAIHILLSSFDDAQSLCAHCLAPLIGINAYVNEECLWHLCKSAFGENMSRWSDAVNGLEKMGWIVASTYNGDYLVVGEELPGSTRDSPTLFTQCCHYYDYWAKQLCLMYEAHEDGLVTSTLFYFDKYRTHFNRLFACWQDSESPKDDKTISLSAFGVLGSKHVRDLALKVSGKLSSFCAARIPAAECVDICCDVFSVLEYDKSSMEYLLSSLDLSRMLLFNNQLADGLELCTELVEGVRSVVPRSDQHHHFLLGSSLCLLAQVHAGQHHYESAIEMFSECIDSFAVHYGMESRQCAEAEHRLGHVHRSVDNLDKAEMCYNKALDLLKAIYGSDAENEHIASVLNDLAAVYKAQGNNSKALEAYSEVVRIRKVSLGTEHIDTANSINDIAVMLHAEGKLDAAKKSYEEALVVFKAVLGDLDPDVAAALNNLGALHDDLGDFEEARSYYESSLAIRRAVLPNDHPDLAASLGNLAALLDDNGNITAAKELYLETLRVARNSFGNVHDDVASTLVNIAALEDELGNLTDAKALYKEALDIFIQLYSENSADVASTLTCLANVAKLQHDDVAVRSCFNRAIAIHRSLHGNESPEVANALTSLGVYLYKTGTTNTGDDELGVNAESSDIKHTQPYEDSSSLLQEAFEIRKKLFGLNHSDVVMSIKNIGYLKKAQRHFSESVSMFEEALRLSEKTYGKEHAEVTECLTQLGVLFKLQNQFKEAMSYFEEAIRIQKRLIESANKADAKQLSLLMATNFASLALVHKNIRNYEDATECYRECFEIQFKELGNDNIEVAKTLHALGLVTWQLGSVQSARKLLEEALDIRRRILPERHPDIIQSLNELSSLLGEEHKYRESMSTYADAIARIEEVVGPDHPDLAVDLLNMALMAYDMGKYHEAIPLFERGLSIRMNAFGDDHELVAEYLLAIANLHVSQRQFREAKYEFEGALNIIEAKIGRQSREFALGLSQFGKCLQLLCQFKEAIPVVNESLLIYRSVVSDSEEGKDKRSRESQLLELSHILGICADVYVGDGNYAGAEPYYEETIEILQRVLGDDNVETANYLIKLAEVLKNQQYFDDAKHVYQEALQVRRQCLGNHLDVVQVLSNLGDISKKLEEFDDALMYYNEAMVMREQLLGEYHQDVAQSVHAVAAVHDLRGDLVEAEKLFQRALKLRRRSLGNCHPDVAQTLNNLAAIYDDLDRSTEAEPLYREALDIYKEVYGDQHPDVALSLNNLAALLDDRHEFAQALKLYEEALSITRKIYGEESLDVASAHICLANALQNLKRFSESEHHFQEALRIKTTLLGTNHVEVAAAKLSIAELFMKENELNDAKEMLSDALDILVASLGPKHQDVLKLRSRIEEVDRDIITLQEHKQIDAPTIHSMEDMISAKKAEYGNDHVAVAELLVQLSNSLVAKERYHDASQKLKEALAIFRKHYPSDHNLVIVTIDKIVSVLSCINECEEALPLLLEVIETKTNLYGDESPSLGDSLSELGSVYDRLDRLEDSYLAYEKMLTIRRQTLGNKSSEVGHALNNLGAIVDDLGRGADAEPFYMEAIEIFRDVFGPNHPDVALSINNLAALLDDRGEHRRAKVLYEDALSITKTICGENCHETASALICVARTMKSLGQFEASKQHFVEAIRIKEYISEYKSNEVALLYDQVGAIAFELEQFDEALNAYNKSLMIRQELYGEHHYETTVSLIPLSAAHEELSNIAEAISLLGISLKIKEEYFGDRSSPEIAYILVKLGELARKNRKPRDSIPYLKEALSIYRNCYGSKHERVASTLCAMASVYKGFRKFKDATTLYRKAMIIREQVEGAESRGVAEVLLSLGSVKEKEKSFDEARGYYEDALDIFQNLHEGKPHRDIAQTMTSLGHALKPHRKGEARKWYEDAYAMQRELHPSLDHVDVAQSMNNLAALLYSMHEYDEAKALYDQSLDILTDLLGNESLDVAQAMNNLAALLFATKNHVESEPLYEESLRIRRKLLGNVHLDVASSLCNLGILNRSTRNYPKAIACFEESLAIRKKLLNNDNHSDVLVCKKHLSYLEQLGVEVKEGMEVEMTDRPNERGKVLRKHKNDTYDIEFDDPSAGIITSVPRSRLTVAGSIFAPRAASRSPRKQQRPEESHSEEEYFAMENPVNVGREEPLDLISAEFERAQKQNKVIGRRQVQLDKGRSKATNREKHDQDTFSVSSSSSSSSSSTSTSSSSASFGALEQSRVDNQAVQGASKHDSPGFSNLKSQSSPKPATAEEGKVHHLPVKHSSKSYIRSPVKHSDSTSSAGSDGRNATGGRDKYKESVGRSGFRRSNKSFSKSSSMSLR